MPMNPASDLGADRRSLDPIEVASRDEIAALQLRRMRWSLAHAYENVPHYTKAFKAAGVHPDDLKSLEDLAKFPFTAKVDLRENYPFGMFAVPREKLVRIHASSGTTGKPTVVGYTPGRHRHVGRRRRPLHARLRRPPRRHRACGLRLWPVHRRAGCPLWRRKARLHRHPRLRRHDARARCSSSPTSSRASSW